MFRRWSIADDCRLSRYRPGLYLSAGDDPCCVSGGQRRDTGTDASDGVVHGGQRVHEWRARRLLTEWTARPRPAVVTAAGSGRPGSKRGRPAQPHSQVQTQRRRNGSQRPSTPTDGNHAPPRPSLLKSLRAPQSSPGKSAQHSSGLFRCSWTLLDLLRHPHSACHRSTSGLFRAPETFSSSPCPRPVVAEFGPITFLQCPFRS